MTNSRSLSWIDRGRWDALLAAATQHASAPRVIGARSPQPAASPRRAHGTQDPRDARRDINGDAAEGGRVVAAVPANAAPALAITYPHFTCESQQLDERLQALVGWIERCVACRAAFIADDNGLPVVEHLGAEQGHIAAASSILLMLASVRSLMRDSGGWLSLKMSSAVLHVVEVTTQWGRFGIGVVTDDLVPQEFLSALSAAVESAFHGETSQGEST
jgi:hypothetical protein